MVTEIWPHKPTNKRKLWFKLDLKHKIKENKKKNEEEENCGLHSHTKWNQMAQHPM